MIEYKNKTEKIIASIMSSMVLLPVAYLWGGLWIHLFMQKFEWSFSCIVFGGAITAFLLFMSAGIVLFGWVLHLCSVWDVDPGINIGTDDFL